MHSDAVWCYQKWRIMPSTPFMISSFSYQLSGPLPILLHHAFALSCASSTITSTTTPAGAAPESTILTALAAKPTDLANNFKINYKRKNKQRKPKKRGEYIKT